MGFRPAAVLSPQDESLFRAFQANLLSLISHELRTPLMGIMNAVALLEESSSEGSGAEASPIPKGELVRMARSNAQRLNRSLSELLDLAQLESGVFHARLREIDFVKTVRGRVEAHGVEFSELGLGIRCEAGEEVSAPILADPQKVVRAIDLCLQTIQPRAEEGSTVVARILRSSVEFSFKLKAVSRTLWAQAWLHAQAGFHGGVASPSSAFAGALQSEQGFLTRQEEGLGSELMLVHEIMRLHHGKFTSARVGGRDSSEFTLNLAFAEIRSEEGVRAVLTSRAYDVSTELASVALVLVSLPKGMSVEGFAARLKEHLFRSSDAVYPLPERRLIALVLDDTKAEDVPRLVTRLGSSLAGGAFPLQIGWAHCPSDVLDPGALFDLAQSRFAKPVRS